MSFSLQPRLYSYIFKGKKKKKKQADIVLSLAQMAALRNTKNCKTQNEIMKSDSSAVYM